MRCGGTRAQQRLAGVKTTGCILSYGLDFWSQMQVLLSVVCGKRETITDQMQAVNEGTQGRHGSNKERPPWMARGSIRGCCVYTSLPIPPHQTRHNIFAHLFEKLHVNDRTSILLWIALHCSSRDSSLSSHVAFQRNMKLLSHWGKSKSCSAAVLWAALCSIALETGLIGMCGPNSPHCLKLAGFMFTTIGFGIAALDCLCFAVRECVCDIKSAKLIPVSPLSIILEYMTLVIAWCLL